MIYIYIDPDPKKVKFCPFWSAKCTKTPVFLVSFATFQVKIGSIWIFWLQDVIQILHPIIWSKWGENGFIKSYFFSSFGLFDSII